ncbi:MAG: alkaline phosphatase [Bacteroidales bacterium]
MIPFLQNKLLLILALALLTTATLQAQTGNKISQKNKPESIILMIGDGMGLGQIHAGLTVNRGQLNLLHFKCIGFSKTYSASDYVTDSGAGGTALASGRKTYNGAIGVDKDTVPVRSILEYAEAEGMSTGLVSTSAITHATPASFIAHNKNRNDYEGIAADFLKTDIDVIIGGGRDNFAARKDGQNLLYDLKNKGYQVIFSLDSIRNISEGKLAGFTAPLHNPSKVEGRGDMLPTATQTALNILSNNSKGFFLMVEGSQIDWASHSNDGANVAEEVIDFDEAVGVALSFAKKHPKTLVIVTADHETGGLTILNGDYSAGTVKTNFATSDHSGMMVPVFACGPGSEFFQGFQENTDIFSKMMQLLDLDSDK